VNTSAAALRHRRTAAARALAADARRAQVAWEDLAAWPEWAGLDADWRDALALKAGAWLHAGALQRCIAGALLQRARSHLGDAAFQRLMATPDSDTSALPEAAAFDDWLRAQGLEALLASVPSAVLRVVLREHHAPRSLPPLPALDHARARHAVAEALR
jgi:hypothetical protein